MNEDQEASISVKQQPSAKAVSVALMDPTQAEAHWKEQASSALTMAFVFLAAGFVYWASPVLIPLSLSVLLAFLLKPIVNILQRWKIPRAIAAFCVTLLAVGLMSVLGWIFVSQVAQLAEQLPSYEKRVTNRIAEIRENGGNSLLHKVQRFADRVAKEAMPNRQDAAEATPQRVILVGNEWSLTPLFSALGPVLEPLAALGLVIVQLIYLLIDSENLRDRLLRLAGKANMTVTTRALDDAGSRISRYLAAQFCLNLAFGVFVTIGLWLLGVPHAVLGGFLAGFLRYIPYLGPWLAVTLPLLLSLIATDGWLQPIGVVLIFATGELLSNIVIEPLVYGRSIGVSQSALIVAIAFWAWLWGPMGLVLAAPLTVCLVILGKYVPALKFFDIMLGDSPVLTTDARLYQRLVAHDEDGAYQIASTERDQRSLIEVYDQLLVPSLHCANRDLLADRLATADAQTIWTLIGEIGEELAVAEAEKPTDTEDSPIKESAAETSLAEDARAEDLSAQESRVANVGRVRLLACPARDKADESLLKLVQAAMKPGLIDFQVTSTNRLASEVTAAAEDAKPAIFLITSLPPGGVGRARLLCMRLRQKMPDLKIVVARCGGDPNAQENDRRFQDAGADSVCLTIDETVAQLATLARLLRPARVLPETPRMARQTAASAPDPKVA